MWTRVYSNTVRYDREGRLFVGRELHGDAMPRVKGSPEPLCSREPKHREGGGPQ